MPAPSLRYDFQFGESMSLGFLLPNTPVSYTRTDIDDMECWLEPLVHSDEFYKSEDRAIVRGRRIDDIASVPHPADDPFFFIQESDIFKWSRGDINDGGDYNFQIYAPVISFPPGEYEVVMTRRAAHGLAIMRYPSVGGGRVVVNIDGGDDHGH